jgi:hypothetical protein
MKSETQIDSKMSFPPWRSLRCANATWLTFILIIGVAYVVNAWSPSSYAWQIKSFGVEDRGLIVGQPRSDRSDESGLITPLTQATVNNNFQRFNGTSFYKEDLRSVVSMPIRDWGLIFKPNMWGYLILEPARAFSLYHVSFIFLFIAGYALLFQALGTRVSESFLLSIGLFFTGYMQFWWTTFGQLAAYFPWLLIVLTATRGSDRLRAVLLYWLTASCMLSAHFYPPLFIQFAFVGLLFLLSFGNKLITTRFVLLFGTSAVAAVLTACFYLREPLLAMLPTVYPGQRISSGGGEPVRMILSQFFPLINIHEFTPLIRPNNPESGVIGSFFFLIVLCFLNYRETILRQRIDIKSILILLLGLSACYAWMLIDLPSWVGRPLLWSRVDSHRMYFTSGMLTWIIVLLLFQKGVFEVSFQRLCSLLVLAVGTTFYFKVHISGLLLSEVYHGLLFLGALVIPCLFRKGARQKIFRHTCLLVIVGHGLWAFGTFNPIQSASVIFDRKPTPVTKSLDTLVENDASPRLAVPGFFGATLNGWGYPSVSHVLFTPKMDFWEGVFPDIETNELNQLFNRSAVIGLSLTSKSALVGPGHVRIPMHAVSTIFQNPRSLSWRSLPEAYSDEGGYIDTIRCEKDQLVIEGWAKWLSVSSLQGLQVISDDAPLSSEFRIMLRYDVVAALNEPHLVRSGFEVRSTFIEGCNKSHLEICVISRAADGTLHRLGNSDKDRCPRAVKQ